ncbi:hypothetical protein RCH15_001961 [Arthrobacter sp. MP_M4]|nr:hypothetical protein [Arthrobacter sp. MP_M4]
MQNDPDGVGADFHDFRVRGRQRSEQLTLFSVEDGDAFRTWMSDIF